MDLHLYKDNIKKTGFPLEFRISETLRERKWSVINSRYYIDDQSGTVREIDIVAYKTRKTQHFHVFTVLIISCKKNEQNLWALLTKKINENDLNMDWKPTHVWTNNKAINFMMSNKDWKNNYYDYAAKYGVKEVLRVPNEHIFAFQEMNIASGKPQNDSSIFGSITSLMKAQAYELSSLPKRKTTNCIYQFNLLSVIDFELIMLQFEKKDVKCCEVEQGHYIGRYIINKEETFAHIHFIKESSFDRILSDYDLHHDANFSFFKELHKTFYTDVLKDFRKINWFTEEFYAEIQRDISFKIKNFHNKSEEPKWINIYWNSGKSIIELGLILTEEEIALLNSDLRILDRAKKLLNKFYFYKGSFEFTVIDPNDVPF